MRVITLPEPPLNRREALRYAALPEAEAAASPFDECTALTLGQLTYRVVCEIVPARAIENGVDLGFAFAESRALAKSLAGCDRALVFAATVGLAMDRLIARFERVSPVRAMLLHAIGAERIESLCDAFCAEEKVRLAAEGLALRPRFSPGYGDLPLSFQREIFLALQPEKHIGLMLTESLIMSPSKSVTAIAGIARRKPLPADVPGGCAACTLQDCAFRGG